MIGDLKNTIQLIEMDLNANTKVGGTRARKSLLTLKKQCDELRKVILAGQKQKKNKIVVEESSEVVEMTEPIKKPRSKKKVISEDVVVSEDPLIVKSRVKVGNKTVIV